MRRKYVSGLLILVLATGIVWIRPAADACAAETRRTEAKDEERFFSLKRGENGTKPVSDATSTAVEIPPIVAPVSVTPETATERWKAAGEKMKLPTPPKAEGKPVPVKAVAEAKLAEKTEVKKQPAPLPVGEKAPIPTSREGLPPEIENFKKVVGDEKKQILRPDRREFVSLSRNYVNRFTCERGKIEKLLAPQDQALEAEIANGNRDLFLRVGMNPNAQFPLDLTVICDGQVFLINAVVHPEVPSQQIVLSLPKGARPMSEPAMQKYSDSIQSAAALPLEEKLSRIVKRIYQGDLLPYWQEIETPTSATRWDKGGYSVLLQRVVRTNLDGIVSWDFVFRGSYQGASTYDVIRQIVRGEIVAFGRVTYDGLGAARIIVLTREDQADLSGRSAQ